MRSNPPYGGLLRIRFRTRDALVVVDDYGIGLDLEQRGHLVLAFHGVTPTRSAGNLARPWLGSNGGAACQFCRQWATKSCRNSDNRPSICHMRSRMPSRW